MDYGSTRNINCYNFAGKCATFPWGKSSSIAPIEIELPLTLTSFSQIIIIIIMITMKIEAILEKLGRGVEQRRKRIIEIPRQEEGRGRIKISWDFYASILLGWQRGKGSRNVSSPPVSFSRGKQQIFRYSRGNSIIPLPFPSLRFFDKEVVDVRPTWFRSSNTRNSRNKVRSRIEISNKFDRNSL